ncbi:unnamed protein product [Caenorhabditis bovis]|uniref:FERM central domain-containing protein n=1 Tax=Caenorhabditis bovis TaxID=2654633 RepID=A0A8S1E7P9_9PELO|nr:unnamed protein product [Caenorhabditis bovis]
MVSPLLEIQLKPYHIPYVVRKGWKTILLERFVDENEIDSQDEPILMLRRNVGLDFQRELEILNSDPKCAQILAKDAREMLISGRIQLKLEDALKIAGLVLSIEHGAFDTKLHDIQFARNEIEDILPEKLCDQITGRKLFGKIINKKAAAHQIQALLLVAIRQLLKLELLGIQQKIIPKSTLENFA